MGSQTPQLCFSVCAASEENSQLCFSLCCCGGKFICFCGGGNGATLPQLCCSVSSAAEETSHLCFSVHAAAKENLHVAAEEVTELLGFSFFLRLLR